MDELLYAIHRVFRLMHLKRLETDEQAYGMGMAEWDKKYVVKGRKLFLLQFFGYLLGNGIPVAGM